MGRGQGAEVGTWAGVRVGSQGQGQGQGHTDTGRGGEGGGRPWTDGRTDGRTASTRTQLPQRWVQRGSPVPGGGGGD